MGQGGKFKGRLADMASKPEPAEYRPPPTSAGDVLEWPIILSPTDVLLVRQHVYRKKTVDFAFMQLHHDGEQHEVARIDCCHGVVHRHQFNRDGVDVMDRRPIQVIPPASGHDTVNALFDVCYGRMMEEYEENLRRWKAT
jgi:hypothetical protein